MELYMPPSPRAMAQHNNFSDLMVEGKDWLDKTVHFLWITAIFFKNI